MLPRDIFEVIQQRLEKQEVQIRKKYLLRSHEYFNMHEEILKLTYLIYHERLEE